MYSSASSAGAGRGLPSPAPPRAEPPVAASPVRDPRAPACLTPTHRRACQDEGRGRP